jgi:hypothetical protein
MQKLRESRPGNWLRGGAAAEAPDLARTGSGAAPGETGVFAGVGGDNPAIASYRFRAKHHGVVTKTPRRTYFAIRMASR